jgi:hypothetical protein
MFIVYVVATTKTEEGHYGYVVSDVSLLGTKEHLLQGTGTETRHHIAAFVHENHADRYRHYLSNHVEPSDFLANTEL